MKSLVSLIEEVLIRTANRQASRQRKRNGRDGDAAPFDPLGYIVTDGAAQPVQPLDISQKQRSRHVYVLGATGSGKTNLILQLLARDLAENRSIAVIDLRGDLVDRILMRLVASERLPTPESITLLDLRDRNRIIGFNPLSGTSDPHSRAYLVLDALKAHSDSWGIQLEETLRNGLIALAEANLSLLELEPLLTEPGSRAATLQHATDPSVLAFFDRYSALSSERQQSWFLPVLNKVTPLLGVPRLRLLFGATNAIDLNRALNTEGGILLVALAVDRLHSAARLVGSLIIGAIESAVMSRVDIREQDRVPVNLYVDEFETMATEAFASIVAEGRRFRLSLTLSHQNLTQIPTSLRHVIRNNVQTQIYFQTGSIDARELRHELSLGDDEDVVTQLQTLPVGRAYIHQRPDEPVLVRFKESRDPRVSPQALKKFTDSVHEAMGSGSTAQVQEFVARRRDQIGESPGRGARPATAAKVRHERLPRRGRKEQK